MFKVFQFQTPRTECCTVSESEMTRHNIPYTSTYLYRMQQWTCRVRSSDSTTDSTQSPSPTTIISGQQQYHATATRLQQLVRRHQTCIRISFDGCSTSSDSSSAGLEWMRYYQTQRKHGGPRCADIIRSVILSPQPPLSCYVSYSLLRPMVRKWQAKESE